MYPAIGIAKNALINISNALPKKDSTLIIGPLCEKTKRKLLYVKHWTISDILNEIRWHFSVYFVEEFKNRKLLILKR